MRIVHFYYNIRTSIEACHETARGRLGGLNCRITDLNKLMACGLQQVNNTFRTVFWNQHVVGVVGRNGKDRNAIAGERFDERQEYSRQRERVRAFQFETDPVMRRMHVSGKIVSGANDGEFVCRARDRREFAPRCPVRDGCIRRKAHDRVRTSEPAKFEFMASGHQDQPSTALRTAARASSRVESRIGSGDDSAVTSNGISVHPSTTASQPSSFSPRITST